MDLGEVVGMWWLPIAPENLVPGTLRPTVEGWVELSLIGAFEDLNQLLNHGSAYETILGVGSGQIVTLFNSSQTAASLAMPGVATSKLRPGLVVLGRHIDSIDSLRFERFQVAYDHLPSWARISGFSEQSELEEDQRHLRAHSVHFAFPDDVSATLEEGELRFRVELARAGSRLGTVQLTQTVYADLVPRTAQPLDVLTGRVFRRLQHFLALATDRPVKPLWMRGLVQARDAPEHERRVKVLVDVPYAMVAPVKTLFNHDLVFGLSDLGTDLGDALRRWFALEPSFEPVLNLYFAVVYGDGMFMEQRFLTLAQAVESYHRRARDRQLMSRPVARALRKQLQGLVAQQVANPATATAICAKFTHLSEVSLRDRLTDLLNEHDGLIQFLVPSPADFVAVVADTRNYFTHFTRLGRAATGGDSLYVVTEQLRFLMVLCLLSELGFPAEVRKRLVERNKRFIHFSRAFR